MSQTNNIMPNRTYPMSPKTRILLDNLSILLPGKSKAELMNIAISYLVLTLKKIRGGDKDLTYTMALETILTELGEIEYQELAKTLIPDNKNNTKLDDFIGISVRQREELLEARKKEAQETLGDDSEDGEVSEPSENTPEGS